MVDPLAGQGRFDARPRRSARYFFLPSPALAVVFAGFAGDLPAPLSPAFAVAAPVLLCSDGLLGPAPFFLESWLGSCAAAEPLAVPTRTAPTPLARTGGVTPQSGRFLPDAIPMVSSRGASPVGE